MDGWLGLQVALPHDVTPAKTPEQTSGPPLSPLHEDWFADETQIWLAMIELPQTFAHAAFVMHGMLAPWRTVGRAPLTPMLVLPQPVIEHVTPAKLLAVVAAKVMKPVLAFVGMLAKRRVATSFG